MGQFQKGIRPDMDKNVIRRGEIVSDSGKLYSVIGTGNSDVHSRDRCRK